MSIQTIIKTFVVASMLSFGLAGMSWSGDAEQKDAGETASVDAAPPADATDEDASAEKAETASVDAAPPADATDEDATAENAETAGTEEAEATKD